MILASHPNLVNLFRERNSIDCPKSFQTLHEKLNLERTVEEHQVTYAYFGSQSRLVKHS